MLHNNYKITTNPRAFLLGFFIFISPNTGRSIEKPREIPRRRSEIYLLISSMNPIVPWGTKSPFKITISA